MYCSFRALSSADSSAGGSSAGGDAADSSADGEAAGGDSADGEAAGDGSTAREARGADRTGGARERALDDLRASIEAEDPSIGGAAPVAVTFKLIADPREGRFTIGGQSAGVGAITLSEGRYQLDYVGPDWSRSCTVQVYPGLSRIKVSREVPGCQSF